MGSSVCFPREAELFFFVTLLPGPEFAEEVLQFSMVLAEEEVLVGKVLKKLPECVEASTLHMQISAVLFSLTLFSSILHFTYCWGCLCSPDNPFGNPLYRAVGFIGSHSWQTGHTSLPAQILTGVQRRALQSRV